MSHFIDINTIKRITGGDAIYRRELNGDRIKISTDKFASRTAHHGTIGSFNKIAIYRRSKL